MRTPCRPGATDRSDRPRSRPDNARSTGATSTVTPPLQQRPRSPSPPRQHRPDRVQTLFHHRQHHQHQSRPPQVPTPRGSVKLGVAEPTATRASTGERLSHITRHRTYRHPAALSITALIDQGPGCARPRGACPRCAAGRAAMWQLDGRSGSIALAASSCVAAAEDARRRRSNSISCAALSASARAASSTRRWASPASPARSVRCLPAHREPQRPSAYAGGGKGGKGSRSTHTLVTACTPLFARCRVPPRCRQVSC